MLQKILLTLSERFFQTLKFYYIIGVSVFSYNIQVFLPKKVLNI